MLKSYFPSIVTKTDWPVSYNTIYESILHLIICISDSPNALLPPLSLTVTACLFCVSVIFVSFLSHSLVCCLYFDLLPAYDISPVLIFCLTYFTQYNVWGTQLWGHWGCGCPPACHQWWVNRPWEWRLCRSLPEAPVIPSEIPWHAGNK